MDFYKEYESINLNEEKENDKEIYCRIFKESKRQCVFSEDNDLKSQQLKIRDKFRKYTSKLNDVQLASYSKQIEKYERLFKRYGDCK